MGIDNMGEREICVYREQRNEQWMDHFWGQELKYDTFTYVENLFGNITGDWKKRFSINNYRHLLLNIIWYISTGHYMLQEIYHIIDLVEMGGLEFR